MSDVETFIIVFVGHYKGIVVWVEAKVACSPSDVTSEDNKCAKKIDLLNILTEHELRIAVPDKVLLELILVRQLRPGISYGFLGDLLSLLLRLDLPVQSRVWRVRLLFFFDAHSFRLYEHWCRLLI